MIYEHWENRATGARPIERAGIDMFDAVRLVLVDGPSGALQQSSSGITAGAEKPSQVVDFGAAAQNRTADLLITNRLPAAHAWR